MSYRDFLFDQYQKWQKKPVYVDVSSNNCQQKCKKQQVFIFDGDNIPCDQTVCSKCRNLKSDEEHKIHTTLFPQPLAGNLDTGKIFLCSLNPGFSDNDYANEPNLRPYLENQFLQQGNSFFWVLPCAQGTDGYNYWRRKINQKDPQKSLLKAIQCEYAKNDISLKDEQIYEMISRIFVTLELFPYHSKKSPAINFQNCNSVKQIKEFVHQELIPNNNYLICFLRAYNKNGWDVTNSEKAKNNVVCNPSPQNPSLGITGIVGQKILSHLSILTNQFTQLI